ncbi:hypothetical protein ACWD64_36190 [Streptomyces antibioticus]|uniref:hypothetical protein n=1 Tax=Streptomyces sp. NPDC046909 TaxID=3155617 RepID=UPI00340F569A
MDAVLADAARTGHTPTVTEVERRLGIRHATFYRHYRSLITDHFRPRAARPQDEPAAGSPDDAEEPVRQALHRVRQENTELRKLVQIYAENVRQLTVRNEELERELQVSIGVRRLRPKG